jgi:hypothetical protein
MVAGLAWFAVALKTSRARINANRKVSGCCIVHLVATRTFGDAAAMEREAYSAQPEYHRDCSDKDKA